MFKEHPAVGIGPGCFGYWYMPYKMMTLASHPDFLQSTENVHDVHSDHLQVLAVSGVPGYAIFLAGFWLFGRVSFAARKRPDERAEFAHQYALPAAVAFF